MRRHIKTQISTHLQHVLPDVYQLGKVFMRRHQLLTFSLLLVALLSLILFIAYGQQAHACPTTTRATALTIPPYPYAQNVTPLHLAGDGDQVQHIQFQTTDPPPVVTAFYTTQLLAAGWSTAEHPSETLWRFGHTEALPLYSFDLEVKSQTIELTTIRIRLWWGSCPLRA
jgi:hypothetical protein